jgi:hypothetical protein
VQCTLNLYYSRIASNKKLDRPTLPVNLQREITQFAIDGFAQKYFSTHKIGLFRRKVPREKMLQWTKVNPPAMI